MIDKVLFLNTNPVTNNNLVQMKKLTFLVCHLIIAFSFINAQQIPKRIDPAPFNDNTGHWYAIADSKNMINAGPGKPRYKPADIKEIADNILLFQKNNGGWPKNYDMFAILTDEQKNEVAKYKDVLNTTFDNGTCYTQIRALAIAYANVKDRRYKEAAIKGLQYILSAQYKNGGWPQYYPLENNYSREITFNDGAMMGIIYLLEDILVTKNPLYDFIDSNLRGQLQRSYEKGIDCILKTQIRDNGVLTAWCQQHDEKTLEPAWARKFEPPSICDGESAGIVQFLMGIDHPNQRIINAVQSAVRWFDDSKILNTRVEKITAQTMQTPFRTSKTDRIVVIDSTAPPIWTRYYELKTHRPLFCNRDSKVVYSLAEVARERRDGYAWYTYAPQKVLDLYPKWQKKWAPDSNVLK